MRSSRKSNEPSITAIDLFCGAGGLTAGLIAGRVKVVAGIDADPLCQFAFETNNPGATFIEKDVCELSGEELDNLWGGAKVRILAGCAPCQPFSTYSQGKNHNRDSRWRLLREFARLVIETLPEFVTMENVPTIESTAVFDEFVQMLGFAGYNVRCSVVNCADFGVPQNRTRLVLLAALECASAPRLTTRRKMTKTVGSAIRRLPQLTAGGQNADDALHRSCRLSPKNLRRIQASVPGGTWQDWPVSLRCKCHRKSSGDGYGAVYGRLTWDEPAPTITTQCYNYGSGRFGHPEQSRSMSLREAAMLQGFRRRYDFESPKDMLPTRTVARLIGNAVPPPLGRAIAASFRASARAARIAD